MKKIALIFVLIFIISCKNEVMNPLGINNLKVNQTNTAEITVNDKKYIFQEGEFMSNRAMDLLDFKGMSVKENFLFTIGAKIKNLKPGKYVIYDCLHNSKNCDGMDKEQSVIMFSIYNSDKTKFEKSYFSYLDSALDLTPFNLEITSVQDENIETAQIKTKRIKGKFDGVLALTEEITKEPYYIVKEKITISGKFDTFCMELK